MIILLSFSLSVFLSHSLSLSFSFSLSLSPFQQSFIFRLDHPHKWSKEFNDFLKKSLVKDPHQRPTADTILQVNLSNCDQVVVHLWITEFNQLSSICRLGVHVVIKNTSFICEPFSYYSFLLIGRSLRCKWHFETSFSLSII